MATWQDRAKAAAKALVITAGTAYNVATGDIQSAAATIAREHATTSSRQIEAEIRRHIKK